MEFLTPGSRMKDRYTVGARLGVGGMGAIYLAEDTVEGRSIALKVLRPDRALDERAVARFEREARVASTLRHPNIIEIYDYGQSEGLWYLAMERLLGIDLAEAISLKGLYQPIEMAQVIDPVLRALEAAHGQALVHRDIKPQNIFLARAEGGQVLVKLVDFGIVQELGGAQKHLTDTGFVLGTPSYLSPEQARGAQVDGRADLYALGCVAFEMLTGKPPYDNPSQIKVLQAQVFDPVPSVKDTRRDLERVDLVDAFVAKSLQKSPDERYATAAEMRQALSQLVAAVGAPRLAPITLPPDSVDHRFGDHAFDVGPTHSGGTNPEVQLAPASAFDFAPTVPDGELPDTTRRDSPRKGSRPPLVRLFAVALATAALVTGLIHLLR